MEQWTSRPNWEDSVSYSWTYKTNIFRAGSGKETRVACREKPRLDITEKVSLWGKPLRELRASAVLSHGGVIQKIDFTDKRAVTGDGGLQTTLLCNETPLWLFSSADIGIFSTGKWTFAKVVSFFDGVITLTVPLTTSENMFIAPVRLCRVRKDMNVSMITSQVANFKVTFEEVPTSFVLPFDPEDPLGELIYHNQGVFPFVPNFKDSWDETFGRDFLDFDTGWGKVSTATRYAAPEISIAFTALAKTRLLGLSMINFFNRRKGRWKPFYLPSYVEDFAVVGSYPIGATELLMAKSEGNPLTKFSAHRNISIKLPGGMFFSEIDNVVSEGENLRVTLHRSLPSDLPANTTGSWLYQVRFASDNLIVNWLTEEVCQFKVAFVVLHESFYELTIGGQRTSIEGDFVTISPPQRGLLIPISASNDRIMISGDYTQ